MHSTQECPVCGYPHEHQLIEACYECSGCSSRFVIRDDDEPVVIPQPGADRGRVFLYRRLLAFLARQSPFELVELFSVTSDLDRADVLGDDFSKRVLADLAADPKQKTGALDELAWLRRCLGRAVG